MAEIKIEMNRDVLTFDDGTTYNLGYWLVKRPYENNLPVDNIINKGDSNLTTNVLCFVDINGNFYGFDGVKTDVNGNKYECNANSKSITITGAGGGVYTWNLTNNQFAFITKSPITTGEVFYVEGDYYIKIATFYQFDSGSTYRYSRYLLNQTFADAEQSAVTIYDQFDDASHYQEYITIISDVKDDSGFYMAATVCKYDAHGYTGTFTANVMDFASSGSSARIKDVVTGYDQVELTENDDPYADGGSSTPGGGNGSFDRSSDPIPMPDLPILSAIDTGFVSLWRPSAGELVNLYQYMWSSAFDLESLKKIFANPIDAIMGFGIIPLNPAVGTPKNLKIGNISTGVNITPITAQYYQVDCGTLYLDNFFDTYLEFEPYSSLEIFLPFCGCMSLSSDDFYRRKKEYPGGGKIQVAYNIDILSGSCVACIRCYDANGHTTTTYEFNGNMLTQIPITGNDFTGLYNAVLGLAGSVVNGVAHAATGNAAGVLGDVVNAAHNVTSAKPSVNRSGTIGGSYGLLATRKPFLIRNIPREAAAFAQNLYKGYPSHVTKGIASLSDYTEFEVVYLHNVPATDPELKEIEVLLKTGVIL